MQPDDHIYIKESRPAGKVYFPVIKLGQAFVIRRGDQDANACRRVRDVRLLQATLQAEADRKAAEAKAEAPVVEDAWALRRGLPQDEEGQDEHTQPD